MLGLVKDTYTEVCSRLDGRWRGCQEDQSDKSCLKEVRHPMIGKIRDIYTSSSSFLGIVQDYCLEAIASISDIDKEET